MNNSELIGRLDKVCDKILNSVEGSTFIEGLRIFDEVQVNIDCGGCYGTQMGCRIQVDC